MTYRCGVGPEVYGVEIPPSVECDMCGARYYEHRRGDPPAWMRNGTAPRGWLLRRCEAGRKDYCPQCKGAMKGTP